MRVRRAERLHTRLVWHRMDVFISYARRDSADAIVLRDALVNVGYEVFGDWLIKPGEEWAQTITSALKKCRLVIVLCSAKSVGSTNVRNEVGVAGNRPDGSPAVFLPVKLDQVRIEGNLEYWLASSQWVDAHERDPSDWVLDVLTAVEAKLGPASEAPGVAQAGLSQTSGERRSKNRVSWYRGPRVLAVAAVGCVLIGAVGVAIAANASGPGGDSDIGIRVGEVVSALEKGQIKVGDGPTSLAIGKDAWVANSRSGSISKLALNGAKLNQVVFDTQVLPYAVVSGDQVWTVAVGVTRNVDVVMRIDPLTASVKATSELDGPTTDLAIGHGSLWLTDGTFDDSDNPKLDAQLVRVNPETLKVTAKIPLLAAKPAALLITKDRVWVGVGHGKDLKVLGIDPESNSVVDVYDVPGAGFVSGIANGFDSLWVAGASLYQLNINTGKIVSKIDTGAAPENVIVASDFLWVTNSDGDLLKINPSDNSTVETKDLYPSRAGELAVGGERFGWQGELTNTVTRLPLPPRPFFPQRCRLQAAGVR